MYTVSGYESATGFLGLDSAVDDELLSPSFDLTFFMAFPMML